MTQHPLGPIDWAKVDPASAIAAVQTNDLRDPDRQAAYQEITNRWNAHEQMLEALRDVREWLCDDGPIEDDGITHPLFVKANNTVNAAIAAATAQED